MGIAAVAFLYVLGSLTGSLVGWPLGVWRLARLTGTPKAPGACGYCGYDRSGIEPGAACPECGLPPRIASRCQARVARPGDAGVAAAVPACLLLSVLMIAAGITGLVLGQLLLTGVSIGVLTYLAGRLSAGGRHALTHWVGWTYAVMLLFPLTIGISTTASAGADEVVGVALASHLGAQGWAGWGVRGHSVCAHRRLRRFATRHADTHARSRGGEARG